MRYHTHGAAVIGTIDGLERKELSTLELVNKIRPYIWPKANAEDSRLIRGKVLQTAGLIFSAKGLALTIPIAYKHLVDTLTRKLKKCVHRNAIKYYSNLDW